MTRPATPTHIEYLGDGGDTTFIFPFVIDSSGELEVRVNGAVQVDDFQYDLTGVGSLSGGTVTFRVAPANGAVISLRLIKAYEQLLALIPNSSLPATSLEGQLDNIVKMIQVLDEELSRRPMLAVGIKEALRHIVFPTPQPLKLWGWDGDAEGISYYDPAIIQVTPSLDVHMVFVETQVVVPSVNGATQLEAEAVFPANSLRLSAIVRVTETFGDTGGLTTISVGSNVVIDLWADSMARTAVALPNGSTNVSMWNAYELRNIVSANSVFLTANSGTFDTDGEAVIIGTYMTFLPV